MLKTVLIVEDEFLIALDHRMTLEGLGWRVIGPAATVKAALHLLDGDQRPDVALLDMNLGKEMVTPVAEALRDRGIPFVISSACDDPVALGGEVFAGVVNIGKPASDHRLIEGLARILV